MFTTSKAKKVLSEESPTLHGRPITKKQRGLLGFIAGGGTPTIPGIRKKRNLGSTLARLGQY
jgi:hypothetical protein